MKYTFSDHIHNYAVWTAARAVQRNFTNTKNIKIAIENTKLKDLINNNNDFSIVQYDNFHRETANNIIKSLNDLGINVTYGRAAKIIAIYIKTISVIRESGLSNLAKIAHPPIDRILLKNAHKENKNMELNKINWTELNENKYFDLIIKLRTLKFEYFWEIERYWTPVQND